MGEREAAERRKAFDVLGGGARCVSSGELSIIKPLFGLVNRSHSHKLDAHTHCSRLYMWGLSWNFFYPVFACFWSNFISSEERETRCSVDAGIYDAPVH